ASLRVGEAKLQTPGADMRRGNEEVCVCLRFVRPGMEESESAEKQENTENGPASACPGRGAARNEVEPQARLRASSTRYGTADPGSPQTETVPGLQRTTSCCAAPGTQERAATQHLCAAAWRATCGCEKRPSPQIGRAHV